MIGAIGVTLYMFSGSHSVLMAELMLRHKGIPYRRVNVLPGVHVPVLRFKRFPNTTVPAMEVDGRRIQGTLEISRELDRLVAEPRLFPLDPGLRAKVEAAERWGEDLQNESRRVLYCMARRDVRGFTSFITPGRARPTRWFLRATAAGLVKVAGSVHGASEAAGRAGVAALPGRIDQIDAWIAEGVLDGPELNAADFQIGVCVSALLRCEDARAWIEGRPAQALARRVAPVYPGHMPAVLPREWLPAVR